jgi:hypothetical protein
MLAKVPVPPLSEVCASDIAGIGELLQQTPLSVTGELPLAEIFPPPRAEAADMKLTGEVVTEGATFFSQDIRIIAREARQKTGITLEFFI